MRVYDRFTFGDLIEISMIDGRQYRSREACYGPPNKGGGHLETNASCPERLAAGRYHDRASPRKPGSMSGLAHSQGAVERDRAGRADGAAAARSSTAPTRSGPTIGTAIRPIARGCSSASATARVANPVVIGGDIHAFFANDLQLDFDDPASPVVATEFVGTSISSIRRPTSCSRKRSPDNPHVRFFESRKRGYVSVDLERSSMQVRLRVVSDAHDPKADIATLKTFAVESGKPGVVEA